MKPPTSHPVRTLSCAVLALASASCALVQSAPSAVRIDGSTGVMPLVTALAAQYRVSNPQSAVSFGTGLGPSARIEAVRRGNIDIALASHGIVVTDIEAQGLRVHKIADLAVVFAVNSSVPLTALDERTVCDIYSGKHRNWRELGGPDLPIIAATRPAGEVDGDVVSAAILCLRTPHPSVVVQEKPEDMARFLAETAGAIGMTTTAITGQSRGAIRSLALDSVTPSAANVATGRYRLTRPSYLVVRAEPSVAVQRFLDFIRSTPGARVITQSGGVPAR